MADIFISYARADRDKIERLASSLKAEGCSVWWDRRIVGGDDFSDDIERELAAAKAVIVGWSEIGSKSRWVKDEASLASDSGKLIAVSLDGADPPIGFRQFHTIDLAAWRGGRDEALFRDVMQAVSTRLAGGEPAPVSLTSPTGADKKLLSPISFKLMLGGAMALLAVAVIIFMVMRLPPEITDGEQQIAERVAAPSDMLNKSIAVLPFVNLSTDPEQQPFVDGLHDALIGELAKIEELRIISRTSMMRYAGAEKAIPKIANELQVNRIVEATVLTVGEEVRIQVQLIEPFPNERHLWASHFDAALENILALHSDVAQAVAREVGATLSESEIERIGATRKVDPSSYDAYLRGVSYINQFSPYPTPSESFAQGVKYLERAAELNPDDPLAFAGLALAYSDLSHLPVPPGEAFPKAKDYARRALALDPTLAGARLALAEAAIYYDWDMIAGLAEFERVLDLDPNNARARAHYGWVLDALGRLDEAETQLKLSVELAPLEPIYAAWLGWFYMAEARYDEAQAAANLSLEIFEDFYIGLYVLGATRAGQGRLEEAIAIHQRLVELYGSNWSWPLGKTYALAGREQEARDILAHFSGDNVAHAWARALILDALGDTQAALDSLEDAARYKHSFIPWIDRNYAFKALRDQPRMRQLMTLVNFGE